MGIYRDAGDGPCGECSRFTREWKDRVVDETVVYNTVIEVEMTFHPHAKMTKVRKDVVQ